MRKNRIEKGSREEFMGLNPHSKGDNFSRSIIFFFDRIDERSMTINAIINKKIEVINKLKIIYIKFFKPYDWKSNILIILYK
jgi:putative AlgH/UPF0301 family transcriptional regulator